MGSQGVDLVQLQGLAVHHDVFHPVLAGDAGEHAVGIGGGGGFDVGVDLIGQAGHLQEAAVLSGHIPCAELQGVQNLLACGLHHAHGVAEGMHLQDVAQGDVPGLQAGTHAAAVDEGDIRPGLVAVGIGAQVAQVGLGIADDADGLAALIHGLGIIDGQIHGGLGHLLAQLLVQCGGGGLHSLGGVVLDAQQLRRGNRIVPGVQAGGELAGGGLDLQPAHAAQLGAAGRTQNVHAVLVLHGHLVGVVAVAVQEGIDAGGVGNDVGVGPGSTGFLVAHMAQGHHVLGARFPGSVNGGLHGVVDALTGVVLHEAVDVVAIIVLEVLGGGGGDGLGGGDAHEGHLHAVKFLDDVGLEDKLPFLIEVAADVGEAGLPGQLQEPVHAVVELVVAGDGNVIAYAVHQGDDGVAGGHGAHRLALDGVAVVHQQHMAGLLQAVADGHQAGIAEALIDAAVDIAGEQNHQVLLHLGGIVIGPGGEAQGAGQHQHGQHKCGYSFHLRILLSACVRLGYSRKSIPLFSAIFKGRM